MKIVEINEAFMFKQGPPRSEGIHVTDVIRSIMDELFGSGPGWDDTELALAAEIGFIWEDALSEALKGRAPERPSEIELDGIAMSPDGISQYGEAVMVDEYKATWKSCNKGPETNVKWMMQTKAYCKAVKTDKCRFRVLYINGTYRPPQPVFKTFVIQFEQWDIDDNWDMITKHAREKGWIK